MTTGNWFWGVIEADNGNRTRLMSINKKAEWMNMFPEHGFFPIQWTANRIMSTKLKLIFVDGDQSGEIYGHRNFSYKYCLTHFKRKASKIAFLLSHANNTNRSIESLVFVLHSFGGSVCCVLAFTLNFYSWILFCPMLRETERQKVERRWDGVKAREAKSARWSTREGESESRNTELVKTERAKKVNHVKSMPI